MSEDKPQTDDEPTVDRVLEATDDLADDERFEVIAGVAGQIDAGKLPADLSQRVMHWRDKAESAASAAEGEDV
jgi:hypothetical protein